jgi:hypothetical protein
MIEIARGRLDDANNDHEAMVHARACAHCSAFLEEQMALTGTMKALASESGIAAPADLESAVLAEFLSSRTVRGRRWMALAAAIAVVAGWLGWLMAIQHRQITPRPHAAQPSLAMTAPATAPPVVPVTEAPQLKQAVKPARRRSPKPAAEEPPFVAIPYTMPLQPWERATVMRMEMPATALAAVGLTVAVPDPRASAETDVIVGQDGRIRAIRLLSISTSNTDRSINQ